MRRTALAAAGLALLAACQPAAGDMTEQQKAALADSVSALHAEMWQPWLAADIDRGMSYFLNSPDLGWAWDGEVRYGYDVIDAWFRPIMAGVTSEEFAVADRRTVVLARDVVCVMEHGIMTVTDTAGVTGPEMPFALTAIWVRHDGEWKVNLGHESTPAPQ